MLEQPKSRLRLQFVISLNVQQKSLSRKGPQGGAQFCLALTQTLSVNQAICVTIMFTLFNFH